MKSLTLLVTFAATLTLGSAHAQSFANIVAEAHGDQVTITYDIKDAAPDQKLNVSVYEVYNENLRLLKVVTGAVGLVTPGVGKKIIWDARTELQSAFSESRSIEFELRAEVYNPIAISDIASSYKRGRVVNLSWTGGVPDEDVTIQLKGPLGVAVLKTGQLNAEKKYSYEIPRSARKSSDNKFLIIGKNSGSAESNAFAIKRRTPLMLKVLPFLAAGAVGAVLLMEPEVQDEDLPPPPDPE